MFNVSLIGRTRKHIQRVCVGVFLKRGGGVKSVRREFPKEDSSHSTSEVQTVCRTS